MADPSSSHSESASLRQRTSPKQILVIEDDLALCNAVRETLEEEGYDVWTAAAGVETLANLAIGPAPDLILLEMWMPVMDGWAFLAELKASATLSTIPVVAMTEAGAHRLFAGPACAGYLTKPFGRAQLLQTVEHSL